jgi:hypothetical protein
LIWVSSSKATPHKTTLSTFGLTEFRKRIGIPWQFPDQSSGWLLHVRIYANLFKSTIAHSIGKLTAYIIPVLVKYPKGFRIVIISKSKLFLIFTDP